MYKEIKLEQGSQEWIKWRQDGTGGSEIPPFLGYTKYKSILDLYKEKTTSHTIDNSSEATRHGNAMEPFARERFINQTGVFIEPLCIENIKKPHFRVSLDGINKERTLISEIKCPFTIWGHKKNIQNISKEYYCQMQYQMLIAEVEINYFVSCYQEHFFMKEYYPNIPVQKEMLKRVNIFWEYVKLGKEPNLKYFQPFSF